MLFNFLPVVSRVTATLRRIKIQLANFQWIFANRSGNVVDDAFYRHHALGPAEPAEGSIRNRVGFTTMTDDMSVWKIIRIIGMKHSPVDNRIGKIRRVATPSRMLHDQAKQTTVVVESSLVALLKMVALTGRGHIVGPRKANLNRSTGPGGQQCRYHCPLIRLGLFATEGTPHTPNIYSDPIEGNIKCLGDQFLHLRGVLI